MKFLEQYALTCGLKIDKPYIFEEFFPIPFENEYIIFHPISKPAKTYDYWNDVLYLIRKNLPPEIKIIRIGDKDEPNFEYCINIQGQTNINNIAYLIARSRAYLGTDTFSMHVAAGSGDKPLLALFSSSPVNNSGPSFGDPAQQVLIEAPRPGKPSYAFNEDPKTINNIKPEEIASKFIKLLGFDYKEEYKTIHFGTEYKKQKQMMFSPLAEIQCPPGITPEIRMDYHFNEQILANTLSQRPCFVVTNKPISLNLLKSLKKNVTALVYLVEKDNSPEFVREVRKLGIKIFLASFLPKEEIQPLKIHYYEIGPIRTAERSDKDKAAELKQIPNLHYHSQKIISAGTKKYSSHAAMVAGIERTPDFEPVINNDLFWDNLNDFYFVQKVQKDS